MSDELKSVLEGLIAGAGGGAIAAAIVVATLSVVGRIGVKYFETKAIEPVRHQFAQQLQTQQQQFVHQMAAYQSALQLETAEGLKKFEAVLEKRKREDETLETIEILEFPVLQEAGRIVRRIDEVMNGRFTEMYSAVWNPEKLKIDDLDGNKKVTAVYRLMRFFGAYGLYLQRSSGLPLHQARGRLRWFLERKVEPVFASGKMLGNYLMLRDTMMELAEEMLDKSTKWDAVKPLGFGEWIAACKADTSIIRLVAERIATLFSGPSPRLALLGIYLIDLRQDLKSSLEHESLRKSLLTWLRENIDPSSISIWGITRNEHTDLAEMDISAGKIPRNLRSPHYDTNVNPMGYFIRARSPERE